MGKPVGQWGSRSAVATGEARGDGLVIRKPLPTIDLCRPVGVATPRVFWRKAAKRRLRRPAACRPQAGQQAVPQKKAPATAPGGLGPLVVLNSLPLVGRGKTKSAGSHHLPDLGLGLGRRTDQADGAPDLARDRVR